MLEIHDIENFAVPIAGNVHNMKFVQKMTHMVARLPNDRMLNIWLNIKNNCYLKKIKKSGNVMQQPMDSCVCAQKVFSLGHIYFSRDKHVPVEIFFGLCSAVGNVSGYRCVSDCRSRGREFDPGPVPYFRGDWSWNNFYGHSPPFRWFIQEGLLSVTSESLCTNYWLTACSSLPRKKCG